MYFHYIKVCLYLHNHRYILSTQQTPTLKTAHPLYDHIKPGSKPSDPRQGQLRGRQAVLLGQLRVALGGLQRQKLGLKQQIEVLSVLMRFNLFYEVESVQSTKKGEMW